jgi:hypothetical protein
VIDRWSGIGRRFWSLAVEIVFENLLQALIRTNIEREGSARGGFDTRVGILFPEPDNAETGAESLLGMPVTGQNPIDHLRRRRADRGGPFDEA